MRVWYSILAALTGLVPPAAQAQVLELPASAVLVAERAPEESPSRFAVGPFKDGEVAFAVVDKAKQSQVWKIREPSLSTSQITTGLRRQLAKNGYEILFDCKDSNCGGYDFRYAQDLFEEPQMHVDLGDFRFLSAWRPGTSSYLSLMVSHSNTGGFVQLDYTGENAISPQLGNGIEPGVPATAVTQDASSDMVEVLIREGWLSLDDLSFATGSSDLSEGVYTSLAQLAPYLLANPDQTFALVGHTDAEGSLAGNIALSQRRAASVLERLVSGYSVPRRQMVAEGVGFLAPRWSNLNEDGRRKNRRVEVILTSTQ